MCQCLISAALVKPSLRVSPRLSLLLGLRPVCKCVSAIRKMGGMVSWSARSTGRGPPGPALSSVPFSRTAAADGDQKSGTAGRWRSPEGLTYSRRVAWDGSATGPDEGVIR